MKIEIPENVQWIIDALQNKGYETYAVGGCIRDSLLEQTVHDWDICTAALPEEVLSALGKDNIISNGLKHGTVTVKFGKELYEITTFRKDGSYTDNRHPDSVTFVRSLKEDLARRDFTMNSMAYNDVVGLCDPFDGKDDIAAGLIRCVGDPTKRFHEDALRILRALRFAARLGFRIEENTAAAIHDNKQLLSCISAERIAAELIGILDGDYVEGVLMEFPDVLCVFIPEIEAMLHQGQNNPHHVYNVWQHTVKVVAHAPKGKLLRLAALLHDVAKPCCHTVDEKGVDHFHGHPEQGALMARTILQRLRLDNKTIDTVEILIRNHDKRPPASPKSVRKLLSGMGAENFERLLSLKRADVRGQNPVMLAEKLQYIDDLERLYQEEMQSRHCFSLGDMKINGSDLIKMGFSPDRTMGEVLKALLDLIMEGELENDAAALKQKARELYQHKYSVL